MGVVIRPAEASDLGISNKMPENPEIWKAVGMLDHFEKIQKLKDKIDGVPNSRRVPGYKVFVCGQPTKEGFAAALEKACGDKWPKDGPIIWLNMRQEPILYVNGNPVCARPPSKIGEYAELGDVTRESVEKDEAEFHRMLKKKAEDDGGKLKVVDVSKKESEIEAKEIMSLTEVIAGVKEKFPGLNHVRIPICNSANPLDRDFDALCATLVGSNVNCPVIVNCQEHPTYAAWDRSIGKAVHKPFPSWTLAIGGCLAMASILPIVVVFILRITGLSSPHVDYEPGSPMKRVETNASTHPMMGFSDLIEDDEQKSEDNSSDSEDAIAVDKNGPKIGDLVNTSS